MDSYPLAKTLNLTENRNNSVSKVILEIDQDEWWRRRQVESYSPHINVHIPLTLAPLLDITSCFFEIHLVVLQNDRNRLFAFHPDFMGQIRACLRPSGLFCVPLESIHWGKVIQPLIWKEQQHSSFVEKLVVSGFLYFLHHMMNCKRPCLCFHSHLVSGPLTSGGCSFLFNFTVLYHPSEHLVQLLGAYWCCEFQRPHCPLDGFLDGIYFFEFHGALGFWIYVGLPPFGWIGIKNVQDLSLRQSLFMPDCMSNSEIIVNVERQEDHLVDGISSDAKTGFLIPKQPLHINEEAKVFQVRKTKLALHFVNTTMHDVIVKLLDNLSHYRRLVGGCMRSMTVYLEPADIEELREQAKSLILPPHVYARSLLVRALREQAKEAANGS